jgi:hypothetical protein
MSVRRQSRSIAARSPRQSAPAAGSRHPASRLMGIVTNRATRWSCAARLGSLIRRHNRPPEEVTLDGRSLTIRLPHVDLPGGRPVPLRAPGGVALRHQDQ